MSCITQLLEMKGDKKYLPIHDEVVIEGGGLYKDHEYLIVFTNRGHRCGYVALNEVENKKFMEESENTEDKYYYPDLSCHGGVTFYDDSHAAKELLPIPCNDFWVGFDAAHFNDAPDIKLAKEVFPDHRYLKFHEEFYKDMAENIGTHRTYSYMEKECHDIIDQLIQVAA